MDLPVIRIKVIEESAEAAFKDDLSTSACPYARGTREHALWVNHYAALTNGKALEAA